MLEALPRPQRVAPPRTSQPDIGPDQGQPLTSTRKQRNNQHVEHHVYKSFQVRSKRAVPWAIRNGRESGHRHVDVVLKCRDSKVDGILNELELVAAGEGAKLIRNKPGQNQRRVIIRFPRPRSLGEPPAGDREPLQPKPSPPSRSASLKPPTD